jgi:hypothetical protein
MQNRSGDKNISAKWLDGTDFGDKWHSLLILNAVLKILKELKTEELRHV